MVHRWEKWSQSLITPPGGKAEIENVEKIILTFSISALPLEFAVQMSAPRGQHTFYIYRPFVKKLSLRFLIDDVLIEILNKM